MSADPPGGGGQRDELQVVLDTLRLRDQQYRLLAEQAADGVLLVAADGRLSDASPGAAALFARPRSELLKRPLADLVERDKAVDHAATLLALPAGQRLALAFRLRRGGTAPPLEVEINARRLADGRLQLSLRDVAERRRAAEALRESEERYESLTAAAADAILVASGGRLVLGNPALRRLLGLLPSARIAGRALDDFVHPEERAALAAALAAAETAACGVGVGSRLRRADGSSAEVEGTASAVTYRGRPAVQLILRETIDERPAAGDLYRDPLTGITSALLVPDRLSMAIAQAYRHRARVGVVHVDLDRFSALDRRLGRPLADRLLRAIARRLSRCVRQGDTAARLGGDAFALVLPGLRHGEDAARIGEKVLRALRKPFPLPQGSVTLSASLGIAVFPEDAEDAPALLASAERSARLALRKGGDRLEAGAPAVLDGFDALELEAALRAALGGGGMALDGLALDGAPAPAGELHYQPIFALPGRRLAGVEALLRWQHPQLGLAFPQRFLSRSDFTGLILSIGPWILRTAARQAREWQARARGLRLSVNLSPPQLLQKSLPDEVRAALSETGLPARLLQLEVPEEQLLADLPRSLDTLHRLKALGVQLVLDHLSASYVSAGRLAELPLDGIKLDLGLQGVAASRAEDTALLTTLTAVARGLNLRVAAQGVETEQQLALVERLGCDEAQGFLLGAPLAPASLAKLLARPSVARPREARA